MFSELHFRLDNLINDADFTEISEFPFKNNELKYVVTVFMKFVHGGGGVKSNKTNGVMRS